MALSRNKELGFRKSHAFVIGINKYEGLGANLKTAVSDAKEIAIRLKVLQGFDHVLLMNDVGKDQIMKLLEWIKEVGRPRKLSIEEETFTYSTAVVQSQIGWLKTAAEVKDTTGLEELELLTNKGEIGEQRKKLFLLPEETLDIQSGDSIVFYYAGHGFPGEIKKGPSGYLAPTDAKNVLLDNQSLLPMDEVYLALSAVNCKHTLLILDCCFAGKFRFSSLSRAGSRPFLSPMYKRRYERYKTSKAWQVLVSAGPEQKANDAANWANIRENSPFAKTLIDALEGKADLPTGNNRGKDSGDGIITAGELFLYVWDRVEKITSTQKPQHPGLFPMAQHREGEFIFINPRMDAGRFKFAEDPDKNPYKGLKSYEIEDAPLYFGRKKAVKDILKRLDQEGADILFVTGPSGSGKSSLIKAGVFAHLVKSGAYSRSEQFDPFLQIRPSELLAKGTTNGVGVNKLKRFQEQLESGEKCILLIDQYEELFMHPDQEKLQEIVQDLFMTVQLNGQLAIFTMRSDFEWQLRHSPLGAYWEKKRIYRIPPMDLDELRQALTGPAWWAMYDFKNQEEAEETDNGERLINEILEDLTNAPGALPLLSFTMHTFYELAKSKNRKQRLILRDYQEDLKGVEGALSARADQVYEDLPVAEKKLMKLLVLRMVNVYEGAYTRRRVYYSKFAEELSTYRELQDSHEPGDQQQHLLCELNFPGKADLIHQVIDLMESNHLVVRDTDDNGRTYVEPAHDSLVTHWDQCRQWLDAFGKENLLLQRQLWTAIEESVRQRERGGDLKESAAQAVFDQNHLWDTNRKLEQLFDRLLEDNLSDQSSDTTSSLSAEIEEMKEGLYDRDRAVFQQFIDDCKAKDHRPDFDALIITGKSTQLLDALLEKGDHWLNQTEEAFICESWEQRTQVIMKLKQERDEAIAVSLAAKSSRLLNENPTIGLNLAMAAYRFAPLEETRLALKEDYLENDKVRFYNRIIKGHSGWVNSVSFSPDGQSILTGNHDSTAILWSLQGEQIQVLKGHSESVLSVCFSSDGRTILTGSSDNRAILWNLQGEPIQVFEGHSNDIFSVSFSPDAQSVLTGSHDNKAILWNLQGDPIQTFEGHSGWVNSVSFSPDGQSILTGNHDSTAILWNLQGTRIQVFEGHSGWVNSVSFSPDGQSILTGSKDETVILWNLQGKQVQAFKGHKNDVVSVSFSPDGQSILTGSKDKTVILWNLRGEQLQAFQGHIKDVMSVSFSPDGQSILTGSEDETVILWNLRGEQLQAFQGHKKAVMSVSFSPDGQSILTGSEDETVILWNLRGEQLQAFQGHKKAVMSVSFSPDGQSILTGSEDKTAILWNLRGEQVQAFQGHSNDVFSVSFSPDGQSVLTGSKDCMAILWNLRGEQIQVFEGHSEAVRSVNFSPDGQWILTGSGDSTAILWNLRGEQIQAFQGHKEAVMSVSFSPDGQSILTGSWDKTAILWNLQGGQIQAFEGHSDSVISVSFSPDDQTILTGSGMMAILWNLRGEQLQAFQGHKKAVMSVSFSPDGQSILTGSEDNTAKLWRNFHEEWAADSIWNRLYRLNEDERKQYKIDWAY